MGPTRSRPSTSSTGSAPAPPEALPGALCGVHVVRWSAGELGLTIDAIAAELGYPADAVPHFVRTKIETLLCDAVADDAAPPAIMWLEPRGLWRVWPVRVGRDSVVCQAGQSRTTLHVGPIVASQLRDSVALAVFVVTVGSAISDAARQRWRSGDSLAGCLLDAIGSAAAERCAERLAAEVAGCCEPIGWRTTHRFSPGYCTWPTDDQRALFALLPAERIGARLTASGMMEPLKSVSGIIGLGPRVRWGPYPCEHCGVPDCTYRARPHKQSIERPDL